MVYMTLDGQALRSRLLISPMNLFVETLRTTMMLWRHYDIRQIASSHHVVYIEGSPFFTLTKKTNTVCMLARFNVSK